MAEIQPKPIYVCQSFPVGTPEQEAAQEAWLNTQAAEGYRLADRRVLGSGGASKRIHLVMELVELDASAEGGV